MIDAASAFVRLLLTLPVINQACSGRIYAAEVPASEASRWQTPDLVRTTILIADAGSEEEGAIPAINAEVEMRIYGKDPDEALYAANLLYLELHRQRRMTLGELIFVGVRSMRSPTPEWEEDGIAYVSCAYAASILEHPG